MRTAILVLLSATLFGCAVDEEPPPIAPTQQEQPDEDVTPEPEPAFEQDDMAGTSCESGELRDCKVQLGDDDDDVQNCFIGMQYCQADGMWSDCMDEEDIDFGDDDDDDD